MPILRDARVLITGGAGFIGSHVAERLVAEGVAEVLVFDDFSRGRLEHLADVPANRLRVIRGDVGSRGDVGRAITDVDILIHLAALRLPQCAEHPRLALEVMVNGTFNVLEAAAAAKVTRVVAASSASVYGMATVYGTAKLFSEGLLASFRDMHGLDYVTLRPFHVYGPRMDIHGGYREALVQWMTRIAEGRSPVVLGDGERSMDWVFVDDVARAFVMAAGADVAGETFEIGTGRATTLNELARALLVAMRSTQPVEFGPDRRATEAQSRVADTTRAHAHLGFTAGVTLEEGLQRLVSWWRHEAGAVGRRQGA